MEKLLEINKLSRNFGGVCAVNKVDCHVESNELVALIGPNGAGKSTLLNMISGVIPYSGGEIHYQGKPLSKVKGHEYAALGIARTFQNLQVFQDMSVLENVMTGFHSSTNAGILESGLKVGRARLEEKEVREKSYQLLEEMKISELSDRIAGSLSYGKLRMLEIARAMAVKPKLLLLDEPAAGLNNTETAQLSELLVQIASRGTSILLVEHDMDLVMTVSQRIIVLDQGEKIAEGLPEEIQRNPLVQASYLGAE